MSAPQALLSLSGVSKSFHAPGVAEPVAALDRIDLDLAAGEVLGLVGESGSGKTTLARVVLGLTRADAGSIVFEGEELAGATPGRLRLARRKMQMVFQDPSLALNPRMTAVALVSEPLRNYGVARGAGLRARVLELFDEVGLDRGLAERRPRQLSGGERQRVAIARALALEPSLLVCDEPVSALDVSVQAQIVELLRDLRERTGSSFLFISHDLSVVEALADRIAVIHGGRIVESAPAGELAREPLHPHTRALRSAILPPDPVRARALLDGVREEGAPHPPKGLGCPFRSRCPFAVERCREEDPPLDEVRPGRSVACFRAEETFALPMGRGG